MDEEIEKYMKIMGFRYISCGVRDFRTYRLFHKNFEINEFPTIEIVVSVKIPCIEKKFAQKPLHMEVEIMTQNKNSAGHTIGFLLPIYRLEGDIAQITSDAVAEFILKCFGKAQRLFENISLKCGEIRTLGM